MIRNLLEADPIREPTLRSIIRALQMPPGSHGLDAGCGVGLQAFLLAEAIGPTGHVTGLDIMPELLAYGTDLATKAGLSQHVTFRLGDISCLPFEDKTFDWVWSADCVGYPAGDLAPLLQELARVVNPGGRVILLGWSSQQLLPGYPLLEARLNATCSGYIPFFKEQSPEVNFMRALSVFQNAGLEDVGAQTFVGDIRAPLQNGERTALTSLFRMLWETPQPEAVTEDVAAYKGLCTPGSAEFILDAPGYYAFFTYTMFCGKLPKI
jgi:demethylmenaquinone methyltransferase/2-methoxy-6-polyprenyl-1,4-benzoquinol methylase